MSLNLFPVRVPIGRVVDETGKTHDVLMTPEFSRALSDLLERVGGEEGIGTDEIASYLAEGAAQPPPIVLDPFPMVPPEVSQLIAEIAALRGELAELQHAVMNPNAAVDWEHPGKIGARTPTLGTFTTLNAGAGLVGAPSFYLGTDSTTGLYRIGANNWGLTVSGVKLMDFSAALVDVTQNVRTSKQFQSTIVTGTAPLIVASTTKVSNLNADLLDGTDWTAPGTIGGTTPGGATFTTLRATGAFGCNGATVKTAAASGGAMATTAATNVSPFGFTTAAQADSIAVKLNAIQAALIANGIMS